MNYVMAKVPYQGPTSVVPPLFDGTVASAAEGRFSHRNGRSAGP